MTWFENKVIEIGQENENLRDVMTNTLAPASDWLKSIADAEQNAYLAHLHNNIPGEAGAVIGATAATPGLQDDLTIGVLVGTTFIAYHTITYFGKKNRGGHKPIPIQQQYGDRMGQYTRTSGDREPEGPGPGRGTRPIPWNLNKSSPGAGDAAKLASEAFKGLPLWQKIVYSLPFLSYVAGKLIPLGKSRQLPSEGEMIDNTASTATGRPEEIPATWPPITVPTSDQQVAPLGTPDPEVESGSENFGPGKNEGVPSVEDAIRAPHPSIIPEPTVTPQP